MVKPAMLLAAWIVRCFYAVAVHCVWKSAISVIYPDSLTWLGYHNHADHIMDNYQLS